MRLRTALPLPAGFGRRDRVLISLPLVALLAQMLLVAPIAQAGAVYPNPPNATPVAWPSSFTSYTTDTGTPISDVEGEAGVGSIYDISSAAGSSTSVFLALSGNAAFFRARVGSNPIDITKGGFDNATWLVLIATEDSPGVWTTKAVTGVDGKPVGSAAAPDTVYVGNAPGTGITDVYQFTKDPPAFDPLSAVGTGARVVAAGGGQYFIDWQIPVSSLVAASGGAITTSTPVRLFFGSSAAANLATINKDYMTGGAISFTGLGTVTLSPPTLTLTESKASVSGPNPPQATAASVYDITVTAQNSGGSSLFSPSIVVSIPAGVSIVSQSSATGSIGVVGQTVTWTPGTMLGGASTISATIRVSVTPSLLDVGSTVTLANAAAGTGSDGTATITGTGTAQTAGPVANAPHVTSTGVSCPGATIAYGGTASCTVTVTDTSSVGATVPTGTVAMSGVLGSATMCTLAAATATSATCTVTFTATGVGTGSLSGTYSSDSTHSSSSATSGAIPIVKKSLTVSVIPAGKTYGDPNPAFSVSYSGFVLGETSAALGGTLAFVTAATTASPVGVYAVTPSGLSSANYAFTYDPANLTIDAAPLTITAVDASRTYGDPNPTLTASYSGFVNGDDAADLDTPTVLATTATPTSDVGGYAITASGATSSNYAIFFVAGTLSVTKATLTVTPQNAAVLPGDPIPTTWATDITGFVGGDDTGDISGAASCSTDAVFGDPAGTYTITCTIGTLSAANYDFTVGGTGIFTIGTVTLHVTVDDVTKSYGDPNPTFTVTYVGFVNGDTEASLGGSLVFATAATTGSPAATYSVSPSGLTSPDYVFDFVDGTLTITQASQTITFGPLVDVTYGDAAFDLTATSTSGLTVTFTASGSCSLTGVTVTITGAGTCTITAHQPGNANYAAATDVPQTLTIDKATPIVTWATPTDITYGTALSGVQLDATASVGGGYVYTPAGGTVLPAGTHTLSVTFTPSDTANYASVTTTVDLDVVVAGQTIAFPPLDNVTSDHDPITLTATASSGLPVTYSVTGPCSLVGNVLTMTGTGTCVVTANQAGNANYAAAPSVTASFEVTLPLDSSISTDREFASPNGHVVVTATGFMPGSDVRVWIQPVGDPVTVTADAYGEVQVTLTIPAGTAAGPLVIEARGLDPNGADLDLTKTITILALPSTSTIDSSKPGAPIGSLVLVVLGLLLLGVAAGVNATTTDTGSGSPRSRRRSGR